MSFVDKVIEQLMTEYKCSRVEAVNILSNKGFALLENKVKTQNINLDKVS